MVDILFWLFIAIAGALLMWGITGSILWALAAIASIPNRTTQTAATRKLLFVLALLGAALLAALAKREAIVDILVTLRWLLS